MNGYSIVIRKYVDKEESKECVPMFVHDDDVNYVNETNPVIGHGIKRLNEKIQTKNNLGK